MAGYFEQDDAGRIPKKYSDESFIQAVETSEPAGTNEVANAVGCTERNAYARLRRLEEDGRVMSKMVGNSLAWWIDGN